ncbi:hypothetical protein KAI04_00175 [Candidatus Pacearchaeota archaeon]|nr:hypothetical protein [Candidatus Pacearchaeota archaeon]
MPYTNRALEFILKEAKKHGQEGWYVDIFDDVTDLGEFDIYEALDTFDEAHIDFPCVKCEKLFDVEYLNPHEPYLNHCSKCIEEEEQEKGLQKYFNSLREKGLLEEHSEWIIKLYPEFQKYLN